MSYQFGPYLLDTAKRLLIRDAKSIALAPKTFDLLLLFVESEGRVLSRSGLMSSLWPDTFVEEANLSFQISTLRKALGNGATEWIETVPKIGYRFSAPVTETGPPEVSEIVATPKNGDRSHAEAPKVMSPFVVETLPALAVAAPSVWYHSWILWLVMAGTMTLAATVLGVMHFREAPPRALTTRFLVVPPASVTYASFSISPNGKLLALVGLAQDGGKRLFVRPLDSLRAEPLAGTELVDSMFWSPDSRHIGFFANGKLKETSLSGPPRILCDAPGGGTAGSWSRGGIILFQTRAHPQLYRVSAKSPAAAEEATELNASRQETAHYNPQFLPDGRHFIYFVRSLKSEKMGIYAGSLDSKDSKPLLNTNSHSVYSASSDGLGYLFFTSGTTLMAQAFDAAKLQMIGEQFPVVPRLEIRLASGLNRGAFSASQNGVLVYRTESEASSELVWVDRHGNRLSTVGEPANYTNPALSPDEKKLMVSREDPQTGTRDLWLFNLEHGTFSRVTFDPADETCATWAPDNSRVAYSSSGKGVFDIYQKVVTSISKPEPLLESSDNKIVQGWSPDGRFILFTTTGGGTWSLPLQGTHPARIRFGEGKLQVSPDAEISPDGQWIAYQFDGPTRSEVYVERLNSSGGEWQASNMGGIEPHWRKDGKELFFIAENKMMAVDINTGSKAFDSAVPKALFEMRVDAVARRSRYQVASNGQRFLINSPLETLSPVTVVVNWSADQKL